MSNHKVPPPFKKGDNFENWKKTIKIWQAVTPLEKSKQGAAIFLSLDHEAREAALEFGVLVRVFSILNRYVRLKLSHF